MGGGMGGGMSKGGMGGGYVSFVVIVDVKASCRDCLPLK